MVFEEIINTMRLQRRPLYALVLGLVYTPIAFFTAFVFFRETMSIAMIFLISLLAVPSLILLLSVEETRERQEGARNFFHNHKDIFEVYLFLFVGIFISYLTTLWITGMYGLPLESVSGEQLNVIGEIISEDKINDFNVNGLLHALRIFSVNIGVALLLFILSLFYGAGSIFLVAWNASVFSTFIYTTITNISTGMQHSLVLGGIFLIYVIPEVAGFLLAAIAGGVVSKAVVLETFMSFQFRNVLRDAVVLLFFSFALLFVAAFLESYVGVNAIKALV
ncbi:hypothetical protein J4228_02710 [Candidatus Woesearchaeota archaeon]|nr:hypothetical protein [Candidatus Woesearchaeota archaeon]